MAALKLYNAIEFWQEYRDKLGAVTILTRRYLVMTTTCTVTDRVFSASGTLLTKYH